MHRLAEGLALEALREGIKDIHDKVGLTVVPTEEWMDLFGDGGKLLARVPRSEDPIGDIDKLRSVWFRTSFLMTNHGCD